MGGIMYLKPVRYVFLKLAATQSPGDIQVF